MNLFTNLHNLISCLYMNIFLHVYIIIYKHIILYILKLGLILTRLFANTLVYLSLTRLIIKHNLGFKLA